MGEKDARHLDFYNRENARELITTESKERTVCDIRDGRAR